jgi:DNA adenine methylase
MIKSKIIPFNYFGGKFMHADFIINHLPETKNYVEVFGGSGVILFNRKPSKIETLNDINSVVINFFECLRDHSEKLLEKIYLTPYCQDEYIKCYRDMNKGDKIERARRFFVAVNQSFNGTYARQTGWKMSSHNSRKNISEMCSRWNSKIPNLLRIINRLRSIQISNMDFRDIFEKFNNKDTLLYCDPPYVHNTRTNKSEYEFEMSLSDHYYLLELCKKSKAKIAISGYESDLYNEELKRFYKIKAPERETILHKTKRQEILWTNYNPYQTNNLYLFSENDTLE